VKIPYEMDVGLVEDEVAPAELDWRPEDDCYEEVDRIAQQPLPGRGQRQAIECASARVIVGVIAANSFFGCIRHGSFSLTANLGGSEILATVAEGVGPRLRLGYLFADDFDEDAVGEFALD